MRKLFYTSKNGFTGILYGKSSLSIMYGDHEAFHTYSSNIHNLKELKEFVDNWPEFIRTLRGALNETSED